MLVAGSCTEFLTTGSQVNETSPLKQSDGVISRADDLILKRTTLPKRVLAPRRNVAELLISPWSKVESSASSSSNSAVGAVAAASAVLTCSSKAMDRVPKGFRAPDSWVKNKGLQSSKTEKLGL